MALRYQNFNIGIGLVPNSSDTNTLKGDLNVVTDGKLYYHNGTTSSVVITENHSATLTNKTIAAGSNTITGLTNSNLSGTAGITNANLANSTISGVSLGSNLFGLTAGSGLSGGPYNGSSAITLAIDTGVVVTLTGSQVLTNKSISGSTNTLSNIANSSLTNSSITINGSTISLGGTATVTANTTNALTIGTGLSGTSFNGSSAITIAIDSSVVTLTGIQALSNKTLTSPVINTATADTITGIAAGDLVLDSPTGKSVVLKNVGSTTATVSSTGLDLASGKILKLSNNSQTISLQASSSASASYTITVPAAAPTSNTALVYDGTNYVWASAGGWSSSVQSSLTAGGTVTISLTQGQQAIEVAGATTAITLSTVPFGSSAPNNKTVVRLIGTSNTNTVTLVNNNAAKGCLINGTALLYLGYTIDFMYITSIDRWVETARNF